MPIINHYGIAIADNEHFIAHYNKSFLEKRQIDKISVPIFTHYPVLSFFNSVSKFSNLESNVIFLNCGSEFKVVPVDVFDDISFSNDTSALFFDLKLRKFSFHVEAIKNKVMVTIEPYIASIYRFFLGRKLRKLINISAVIIHPIYF